MEIIFYIHQLTIACFYIRELGNYPRLARDVMISFVILNKNTLNMFNLDIGSVLNDFFGLFC